MPPTSFNLSPTYRQQQQGSVPFVLACLLLCSFCCAVDAQTVENLSLGVRDKVIINRKGGGQQILRGTIQDYTGELILIQLEKSKQTLSYPVQQIERVETSQTKEQIAGLKLWQAGKTKEAEAQFQAALREDGRVWMRREILGWLVRCSLRLGDRTAAGVRFQLIIQSDPRSIHFKLIPMAWRVAAAAESPGKSLNWLDSDDAAIRLLGASDLLFDKRFQQQAHQELLKLVRNPDRQVSLLALAQLWRKSVSEAKVTTSEFLHWERQIELMPDAIRAGPRYVLGTGYRSMQMYEQAAQAFLWVPLVYDHDYQLAATACYNAADCLHKIGQTRQTLVLLREIEQRYQESKLVGPAIALRKQITGENTNKVP